MPTRTRRTRARSFGGGGGGLDLSALTDYLQSTGTQPNPQYDPTIVSTNNPKLQGYTQPIRATNIFAKPKAAELNTQFALDKANLGEEGRAKLRFEEGMSPILTQRKQAESGVETEALKKRGENLTEQEKERAYTGLLAAHGLPDRPEYRQAYESLITHAKIAEAQAKAQEGEQLSQLGIEKALAEQDKIRTTKDTDLQTEYNKSLYGKNASQFMLEQQPAQQDLAKKLNQFEIPKAAAELQKLRTVPATTGGLDIMTGREIGAPVKAGGGFEAIAQKIMDDKAKGTTVTPTVSTTRPTGMMPVNPPDAALYDYITVDGKLFKVPKRNY